MPCLNEKNENRCKKRPAYAILDVSNYRRQGGGQAAFRRGMWKGAVNTMKGTAVYHSPVGDIRLEYEDGAVIALKKADGPADEGAPNELTEQVFHQLEEYFSGTRQAFDFPYRLRGTPFQERVWAALREIPYGQTRTYQQIAAAIGQPKACRAVGMANHANPLFIVIPCHRVIGANGSLVGYGGGLEMKKALLELEAGISHKDTDDKSPAI